jgi:hypothetical protein
MASSTAETIHDFFPLALAIGEQLAPGVHGALNRATADPHLWLGRLDVRLPLLAPLAALGAVVGLVGARALARSARLPGALPAQVG